MTAIERYLDEGCKAGLKVKDVVPGVDVKMPATAPGVPLFLDSPADRPLLAASTLTLVVPAPEGDSAALPRGDRRPPRSGRSWQTPVGV